MSCLVDNTSAWFLQCHLLFFSSYLLHIRSGFIQNVVRHTIYRISCCANCNNYYIYFTSQIGHILSCCYGQLCFFPNSFHFPDNIKNTSPGLIFVSLTYLYNVPELWLPCLLLPPCCIQQSSSTEHDNDNRERIENQYAWNIL